VFIPNTPEDSRLSDNPLGLDDSNRRYFITLAQYELNRCKRDNPPAFMNSLAMISTAATQLQP
jgi:hypothetical protein